MLPTDEPSIIRLKLTASPSGSENCPLIDHVSPSHPSELTVIIGALLAFWIPKS